MDKYYLITGNVDSIASGYLSYSQILLSAGVTLVEVPKTNISFAIPRVNWIRGKSFDPYTETDNETSYAVYNNNVYLCLSNNDNSIKNITNSSNYAPTHLSGKHKYADGYIWLFLYAITSTVSSLSNTLYIPAPSVYGLKSMVVNQEVDVISCDGGSTGTCVQYLTQSGNTYATLLYSGITTCSICYVVAEETTKTDLLWTRFYEPSESIPSSISLFDYTASLENAIASGKLNSKLNFEVKNYETAKISGLSSGCILSANINLAEISAAEITDNVATNTYLTLLASDIAITVTGGDGSGASISFIRSNNIITGIQVVSGGSNYIPESVSVLLPNVSSTPKRTAIINSIELVGTPPSLVFPAMNSIFDVASQNSIGEDRVVNIVNAKIDAYTTANFYGIVKNDAEKTDISEIIPSRLAVFALSSVGSTSDKEVKSFNFIQNINTAELHKR